MGMHTGCWLPFRCPRQRSSPQEHLYQINMAKASRNGAFDRRKMRHLTGYVDLEFVCPTVPVLFKTRPGNDVGEHIVTLHGRRGHPVPRCLMGDLCSIAHWPTTACSSSTVRGQRTRHRLSRRATDSFEPGSRSRSAVIRLMGSSAPARGCSVKVSASEPSRRSGQRACQDRNRFHPVEVVGGHDDAGNTRHGTWTDREAAHHVGAVRVDLDGIERRGVIGPLGVLRRHRRRRHHAPALFTQRTSRRNLIDEFRHGLYASFAGRAAGGGGVNGQL